MIDKTAGGLPVAWVEKTLREALDWTIPGLNRP